MDRTSLSNKNNHLAAISQLAINDKTVKSSGIKLRINILFNELQLKWISFPSCIYVFRIITVYKIMMTLRVPSNKGFP